MCSGKHTERRTPTRFSHRAYDQWLVTGRQNRLQNPLGELMHKSPPVIFPDFEATFPCSKIPGGKSAGMYSPPWGEDGPAAETDEEVHEAEIGTVMHRPRAARPIPFRLMLTVLGGLAEFERELIRARTGESRSRAKARGVRLADRLS
jgi:Resolvase, N terminal domain